MTEANQKFYGNLVSTSPVVDYEMYDKYVDAIHHKIKADDVCNIGVIAPYGAGKSSLIKTYKDKYPKEKTITTLMHLIRILILKVLVKLM